MSWFRNRYLSPWKPVNSLDSRLWKKIHSVALLVKSNFTFQISRGCNFSMNWDPWCNGNSLMDFLPSYKFEKKFVNCYTNSSGWALPSSTPLALRFELSGINFAEQPATAWDGSVSPTFATFYLSYFKHLVEVNWHSFLWHKRYSLRYSAYAWMAVLGKLKTVDQLRLRGIDIPAVCYFCDSGNECHSHLFFGCDYSFTVICTLLPELGAFLMRPNLMQTYDYFGSSSHLPNWEKYLCFLVINCTIYFVWRERNTRRFDNVWKSPIEIVAYIRHALLAKVKNWKNFNDLKGRFELDSQLNFTSYRSVW
ncbi:uncharacterized protein LOC110111904 [Dendrobium catenatum]|uniref:uncharacterized protein LOC110111904 n=1 Tax=Dendrobium catenatum TaxID=906689 RepID=UPI0009F4C15B|nr:uncharacterized protein LOC110111904 [Dendrobium catenatum]